jgi:hypothetical protein
LGELKVDGKAILKRLLKDIVCKHTDCIHVDQESNMRKALVAMIALMMEAANTSETLAKFYQQTRCKIPEDSDLQV